MALSFSHSSHKSGILTFNPHSFSFVYQAEAFLVANRKNISETGGAYRASSAQVERPEAPVGSLNRARCNWRQPDMEGAFTHLGNHLISDSAPTINAGDDLSTIDADESILDREYGRGNLSGGPRRRRHDDEDDGTEAFEDDDAESMASIAVEDANGKQAVRVEEEKELPPHACSLVSQNLRLGRKTDKIFF